MAKTIMILGAGVFQLPAIEKARAMGLTTVVCGGDANEAGLKLADRPHHVNTVDLDAVLNVARSERIDGIMTIASDVSVPTVSFVAESLGLPGYGYDAAQTIQNKYSQRRALAEKGIPCPRFGLAHTPDEAVSAAGEVGYPVIIKPLESSGSRGIAVLEDDTGIKSAFEHAAAFSTNDRGVIVEQFISGREVGGECLIHNGRLEFIEITNKYLNPWHVPLGHSVPSTLDGGTIEAVGSCIERCVGAFGLENGPLNLDVMITRDGPFVLELGARLGGNCLPTVMALSTGVDTVKAVISMSLGETPDLNRTGHDIIGVRILGSLYEGVLETEPDTDALRGKTGSTVLEFVMDVAPGEVVQRFDQGSHRFGHVILKGDSIEGLESDLRIIDGESAKWVKIKE
ncbi:MAG: ATP-grasp domain-containing protein [Candidatus Latescibacteria bacterium]|nr:ATP-grasp domain-containing protein [Candidatus Latescibacterota bacterium]